MTEPRAAAVYARISSDQEGFGLGVERQLQDCRHLAASLGWPVAEEYVDNDLSAYSGKLRPGYRRMVADIGDGVRDAVIVYDSSRLHRQPFELEKFLAAVSDVGLTQVRFVSGSDVDLANGDGLFLLRIMAAKDANESATKSRRIKRKMEEVAASGKPHGGYLRPFGFEPDRINHRPDEAEIVRAVVARYLAGESLHSLATWLDNEGVPTVCGGVWKSTTLRPLLSSGRIAGLRILRGQVVGPGVWDPIITESDRAKVLARMAERAATGRRSLRRYLLSGLLRCGRCDGRLFSAARESSRRYVCKSGPDHGGCGRLTVVASPVEEQITRGVLHRLDSPELADALAGRAAADQATAALSEQLSADRIQLDELARLFAARDINARQWLAANKPIEARIHDTERRLARATHSDALAGLVGNASRLRTQWPGLNLDRQHAIVAAVLDHAVIAPGTPGARSLDPARVDPHWRP